MRRLMIFVVVCFMFGCDDGVWEEDEDYEDCVCEECPECPEPVECPELIECPECPECPEYPEPVECPECPEIPENPFDGEYNLYLMTIDDPELGEIIFPFIEDYWSYDVGVNMSMGEEDELYHPFYLHFAILRSRDEITEVLEEFYFLGSYSFSDASLFVEDKHGRFMWFYYDVYDADGVSYLSLYPQYFDTQENVVEIVLQRTGDPGQCGAGDNELGHCYLWFDCFYGDEIPGCYRQEACFELGGVSWRQCNWNDRNQTHNHDGSCIMRRG